jgi:hypothetical protein
MMTPQEMRDHFEHANSVGDLQGRTVQEVLIKELAEAEAKNIHSKAKAKNIHPTVEAKHKIARGAVHSLLTPLMTDRRLKQVPCFEVIFWNLSLGRITTWCVIDLKNWFEWDDPNANVGITDGILKWEIRL